MKKGLRFGEKWFQRALWLIAIVFAGFLIGLGGLVVGDLPQVEKVPQLEDYMDKPAATPLRKTLSDTTQALRRNEDELDKARLLLESARNDTRQERAAFQNWIASRNATAEAAQNPEIAARTRKLDTLVARERDTERAVEALQQKQLALHNTQNAAQDQLHKLEFTAGEAMQGALRKLELRVFLARLAFTLPLLAIAGWLFVKQRKSTYWPFVWGFIFFAGFAFFVELVPYLPSYGGYVRYIVGIVLTALLGHYAIRALQRYLERQRAVEAQPDVERRQQLDYDEAQNRLVKKLCPGCERPVALDDTARNFCVHCGICLFDHCAACTTRKSAFARFCHACGTVATATPKEKTA